MVKLEMARIRLFLPALDPLGEPAAADLSASDAWKKGGLSSSLTLLWS